MLGETIILLERRYKYTNICLLSMQCYHAIISASIQLFLLLRICTRSILFTCLHQAVGLHERECRWDFSKWADKDQRVKGKKNRYLVSSSNTLERCKELSYQRRFSQQLFLSMQVEKHILPLHAINLFSII